MARLGVIVLTRTPALFRRLLDSLGDTRKCFDFCIVVDNGQSQETQALGLTKGWAVLAPATNLSFSEGNNAAARVAISQGCTHLLLLNDDVIASPKFAEGVRAHLELADPVVGYRITDNGHVNHDGTCVWRNGATDHIGRGAPQTTPERAVAVVPSVTFAAATIRADAWRELDGLDEGYYYGWEDTDFCLRVLAAGGTVRVCRTVDVEHGECGTRIRGSRTNSENAERFLGRWQSRLPALLAAYKEAHPDAEGIL